MVFDEIKSKDGKLLGIKSNIDGDMDKGLFFFGQDKDFIQVALFNYDEGKKMNPHNHIERPGYPTMQTQEILLMWRGNAKLFVFDEEDRLIKQDLMMPGDFYIYYGGGVGYKVLSDDTRMIEVKVGPFEGSDVDRRLVNWEIK